MRTSARSARRRGKRSLRGRSRTVCTVLAIVLLAVGALSGAAHAVAPVKPKVTAQPASLTVEEGQVASFSSTASGTPTPTVQWEMSSNGGTSWTPIEGATATPLTIASVTTSEDGHQFRAAFLNSAGSVTSKAATLSVHNPPAITAQPAGTTVEEGQSAVFEASASGFPAPTVQWQTSPNGGSTWTNVPGATSHQLTVAGAKTSLNGQQYRAVFTNVAGKAMSQAATLTVQKAPLVTKQPVGAIVEPGQNAVFEASASGFPTPSVQWEASSDGGSTWSTIEGAMSNQLTIADAQVSEDGRELRAVFTNAAGSVASAPATLTIRALPLVTQQPSSTIVAVGEGAAFEAAASGFPAPSVQWEISTNGGSTWSAVPGATAEELTIEGAQSSDSGHEYRAAFTNAAGKATSDPATLTVASDRYNALAWGQNVFRQLGDGTFNASSNVPVQVSGLTFVTSIAAGGRHSLALVADGTVLAWGDNGNGQLGDGTQTISNVPVAVKGLTGVKAVSAGANHSLALLSNGTVMAWGANESGQLGNGKNADSEVPVAVKALTGVKAISAGANHNLALLGNGTVVAWGENESGQLGNGNTNNSSVPVAVKGLTGVSAISAGGEFSLALLAKGTVEAWGSDEFGQLGGSAEETEEGFKDTPVAVAGLSGVSQVAAGGKHSLALLSGGTVMAWGEDHSGQLGSGTIKASEPTPLAVSGLSGVTSISAGGQDSVALLGSGSLMSWGADQWGTLGDGVTGNPSAVPVEVRGLAKVASVSAGGEHMLAFGEPLPTVSSVSPATGPLGGGNSVTITGSDLSSASAVKFGASQATGFTVNSATSITATAPAGTGTVDVTVTTPTGTSPAGSSDRYTYQPPPTITKLSAKSGPAGGGTSVTITGSQFTGLTAVRFGGTAATQFTVSSPTSITAVSPAAATAATVDVTVTNVGGASGVSAKDHFRYIPTIEGVSPNGGATLGGASVTVTGAGFALGSGSTLFKFGKAKATSIECASTTSCTMTAPAHAAVVVDVIATVAKLSSPVNAPADQFSYS